jgi:hypothetical protein
VLTVLKLWSDSRIGLLISMHTMRWPMLVLVSFASYSWVGSTALTIKSTFLLRLILLRSELKDMLSVPGAQQNRKLSLPKKSLMACLKLNG